MKRLIVMTCLILTGCTTTHHEQLSNLGFTRHYLDGYQDGCHSQRTNGQTYHDGYRQILKECIENYAMRKVGMMVLNSVAMMM